MNAVTQFSKNLARVFARPNPHVTNVRCFSVISNRMIYNGHFVAKHIDFAERAKGFNLGVGSQIVVGVDLAVPDLVRVEGLADFSESPSCHHIGEHLRVFVSLLITVDTRQRPQFVAVEGVREDAKIV